MDLFLDAVGIFPINTTPASVGMDLRIVEAMATSEDGLHKLQFDARPWLDQASDEDLLLLLDEWLTGDGAGCRRLLEGHSRDTQAFLGLVEQCRKGWTLRVDADHVRDWFRCRKPYLEDCIDDQMIKG